MKLNIGAMDKGLRIFLMTPRTGREGYLLNHTILTISLLFLLGFGIFLYFFSEPSSFSYSLIENFGNCSTFCPEFPKGQFLKTDDAINRIVHTKAICEGTTCRDFLITCAPNNSVVGMTPLTGFVTFPKDWKDTRIEKSLCVP